MFVEIFLFVLGIALLIKGADWLIEGSTSLARKLGISSLIIGLTVVAFGTSMPELVISLFSTVNQTEGITLGNIIGSNISNILLILGLTAVVTPILINKSLIKLDLPFSLISALILLITVIVFPQTNKAVGVTFLVIFSFYVYYRVMNTEKTPPLKKQVTKDWKIGFFLFMGSLALYFGGRLTVNGVVFVARNFGLSDFLISATIIAVGTSLPELVTSIKAAMKKDADLAIGNLIGSNIFNIFWVLGISALIKPIILLPIIKFDLLFLCFVTLLIFAFLYIGNRNKLDRFEGMILLILYLMYVIFLINRG